jgi:transposase
VDVSARHLDAVFVDESGSPRRELLRVKNEPSGFATLASAIRVLGGEGVLIGCESTSAYHRPLMRSLDETEPSWGLVELNPLVIKRFSELELRGSRSDRTDANSIAQYLRAFRPKARMLPDKARRDLTMIVRSRRRTVEERSRKLLRLRRLLVELLPGFMTVFRQMPVGVLVLLDRVPSPDQWLRMTAADLDALRTPKGSRVKQADLERLQNLAATASANWSIAVALPVRQLARAILQAYADVDELDAAIKDFLDVHAKDSVLWSIPGVGPLTVATLLAEVGDIRRFPTPDHFIGYCGLYPQGKTSGEGRWSGRMVRKGNRCLRTQLLLASTSARIYNAPVREFYERKRADGKSHTVAGGAAARKLAVQIHAILWSGKPFDGKVGSRSRTEDVGREVRTPRSSGTHGNSTSVAVDAP